MIPLLCFAAGFSHRNQPQSIDLNALRLCFQVFLEGSEKGKFTFPLKPQVSDPIYDKSKFHMILIDMYVLLDLLSIQLLVY